MDAGVGNSRCRGRPRRARVRARLASPRAVALCSTHTPVRDHRNPAQVVIWDVGAVRQRVATLRVPPAFGDRRSVTTLAWSANSRLLFVVTTSGFVHVWAVTDGGALVRTFAPPSTTASAGGAGDSGSRLPDAAPQVDSRAADDGDGLQATRDGSGGPSASVHAGPAVAAVASASALPVASAGPPSLHFRDPASAVRFVKPHPVDCGLLLLVPYAGLPTLVDWRTGEAWQVRHEGGQEGGARGCTQQGRGATSRRSIAKAGFASAMAAA